LKKTLSLLVVSLLVAATTVALVGCGGKSSPTAPSTPQPFHQTLTGTVDVFGTTFHPVTIPRTGQMTISLTWPETLDLDLYLTNSACSADTLNQCQLFASATGTVGNREVVTRSVTQAETFRVFVDNTSLDLGSNYTLQIDIQ
jgi:hypothetical protein